MIRIENLHKYYTTASQPLHVLKGINLHIECGEMVSVMGMSGSGKSTLLNILGILDQYDEGTYYFSGQPIKNLTEKEAAIYRNRNIGFVFQSFNLIEYKNALKNVALPLYYQNVAGKKKEQDGIGISGTVGNRGQVASQANGTVWWSEATGSNCQSIDNKTQTDSCRRAYRRS
jgi:putative ABC transport system ATP-binding protein